MVSKSREEATATINGRISEGLEEMKNMVLKMKA
jgi:hypothetical protein